MAPPSTSQSCCLIISISEPKRKKVNEVVEMKHVPSAARTDDKQVPESIPSPPRLLDCVDVLQLYDQRAQAIWSTKGLNEMDVVRHRVLSGKQKRWNGSGGLENFTMLVKTADKVTKLEEGTKCAHNIFGDVTLDCWQVYLDIVFVDVGAGEIVRKWLQMSQLGMLLRQTLAASLLKEWAFLYKDPEARDPNLIYRSAFMLEMIDGCHINLISGFLDVPALNTDDLQLKGMQAVIAACAALLEHNFVAKPKALSDGHSIGTSSAKGNTSKARKAPIKCNKSSSKDSTGMPAFSEANCGLVTMEYYESIKRRGPKYTMDVIALVHQHHEAAQLEKLKNAPAEELKPKGGHTLICIILAMFIFVHFPMLSALTRH
ncbi:hypothetical protein DEU56DRAFT_755690 [Suillus clintonianus]|uniref:uncharacterized protein n=1 Tax=Suillus clintonianus TaxID=1904413 RepID=UPI001B8711C2|nr:uncharacterized protein DEU56DRAFT_755690 [Suillus clintonianus]KAG2138972.1 hypothetical protein DEU56DRAFT_755690 [Suillus clintonianus]